MEEKVIRPSYHSHPLILKQHARKEGRVESCFGCNNPLADLEMTYVCMEGDNCFHARYFERVILHKKCGEFPSETRHPKHPQHPLSLSYFNRWPASHNCDVCGRDLVHVLGYRCDTCDFNLDAGCEKIGIEAVLEVDKRELQHPSHPHHPLTLMRKPPFSFYCDGCGAKDVDMAYICSTCEFWVHKSCATLLPLLVPGDHNHHHYPLSLAFSFPEEHRRYKYKCEVCDKHIDVTCWVYYCSICRYFVHIKCILGLSSSSTVNDYPNLSDEDGAVEFPLHAIDISSKLITPFVMMMRERDTVDTTSTTTTIGCDSILLEYYHEHPLSFVSEFTMKQQQRQQQQQDEEDEEGLMKKICDVCVTPISNSTPYYECGACSYSIHSICSKLPHTLLPPSPSSSHSHPLQIYGGCFKTPSGNHNFKLINKSTAKDIIAISPWHCDFCDLPTNGMGYECGDCGKKIDVKCASLPTTIRHASHTRRHHTPLILTRLSLPIPYGGDHIIPIWSCHGCISYLSYDVIGYFCSHDGCDFALDLRCSLLSMSITEREWDKHPLPLTFDASRDHPSDFYCELYEKEMHPKEWMYHCRQCDASFHHRCLRTGSGYYRNMKLGRRYEFDGIHPQHPLTFTCVTLKKHCDLCHKRELVYNYLGFECVLCYYVVCEKCGVKELEGKRRLSLC